MNFNEYAESIRATIVYKQEIKAKTTIIMKKDTFKKEFIIKMIAYHRFDVVSSVSRGHIYGFHYFEMFD